ncbi:MAG TPA: histidine phosphatase family protein [Thermoanaerobaculia bacterium]|nr:histidine phosphatase family protein [Thermoanaerobaculia bacterium]
MSFRDTRLFFIRHGHTAANSGALMSGWTDFPLSPLGRRQAEALSRRFLGEPPVSALYTSPLQRASDTARALTGLRIPPGDFHPLDDLREVGCGEVDGWPVSRVLKQYPGLWEANLRQDDPGFRWPGGESYQEFRERCLAAVRRIAAAHPGERVAVVTHAGVICTVVGWLHGTSPAEWRRFRPGNCSLTEVSWSRRCGTVIRFDDRSHLVGLNSEEETEGPREEISAALGPGANTCPPGG